MDLLRPGHIVHYSAGSPVIVVTEVYSIWTGNSRNVQNYSGGGPSPRTHRVDSRLARDGNTRTAIQDTGNLYSIKKDTPRSKTIWPTH